MGCATAASLHARFKTSLPPAGSGSSRSTDGGVAELDDAEMAPN